MPSGNPRTRPEYLPRDTGIVPRKQRRPCAMDGFHSGDQGEVNANGNWRITGRIKNLIILNSGHNIAPEPMEEKLLAGAARRATGGADRERT